MQPPPTSSCIQPTDQTTVLADKYLTNGTKKNGYIYGYIGGTYRYEAFLEDFKNVNNAFTVHKTHRLVVV